jgi:2-phosphosulfolactate phosphatase
MLGGPYGIIPAGERWRNGTLRPAFEDLLGAGAIAAQLPGTRSPEAAAAIAIFGSVSNSILDVLVSCSSGRELVARGFLEDVQLAAQLDAEILTPELIDGAFVASPLRGSHA